MCPMQYKPKHDFLKYWRVVRYYIKAKYGLSTPDLEMLLFLYSEKYFSKSDFANYEELMSWDQNRWNRLREEGWIEVFRKRTRRTMPMFMLSYKARGVVKYTYQKMLANEDLSVDVRRNPMGRSDASYNDKVYRNQMVKVNEEYKKIRKERRTL